MNIFKKFYLSIYSPHFYKQMRGSTLGAAILYFCLLCLFLALMTSAFLSFIFTIGSRSFLLHLPSYYPANLVLSIQNGVVHTSVKEPYFVPNFDQSNTVRNFIVIDTKDAFTQTQFDEFNSYIWITRDSAFFRSDTLQTRSIDLSKIKSATLSKTVLVTFIQNVLSYLPVIVGIVAIFIVIGFFFIYSLGFIELFLTALLIWLIAKKLKNRLTYKQSYILSIYLSTVGMILGTILSVFARAFDIPFLVTILSIIIFLINFRAEFGKKKSKGSGQK